MDTQDRYAQGQTQEAMDAAMEIFAQFAGLVGISPDDPAALAVAKRWQEHINMYYYECPDEVFAVVGQFYPTDKDFVEFTDGFAPGTAQFMCDVIAAYCAANKQ
ncbi:MAG: TipAS antibiotic-recognition domain-containing protein [Clostridia bacterium]|nr:TipAS antibiotic-recognition domain-containing protein [Clostridia bacterium]